MTVDCPLVHYDGLVNLGNTCFINCVMQFLLACTPVVDVLRKHVSTHNNPGFQHNIDPNCVPLYSRLSSYFDKDCKMNFVVLIIVIIGIVIGFVMFHRVHFVLSCIWFGWINSVPV